MTNHIAIDRTTLFVACAAVTLLPRFGIAGPPLQVPPADEIIVLDPRVDPEGKPRAEFVSIGDTQQIEIPPSLLVHRYYYSGDRDFQGPMVPGGNTLVVLKHPYTGEQISVEVPLSPGAPRIYYRQEKIIYEYPHTTITLHFGHLSKIGCTPEPKIFVSKGKTRRDGPNKWVAGTKQWFHQTGIPTAAGHVAHGAHDFASATANVIHTSGEVISAPVVRAWNATPLGSITQGDPGDIARERRDREVQRVERRIERESADFPTIR